MYIGVVQNNDKYPKSNAGL